MEVQYAQAADPEKIRANLTRIGLTDVTVQNFGTSRDVLIRLPLKSGQFLDVSAPLPPHMQATFDVLGFDANRYDAQDQDPEDD